MAGESPAPSLDAAGIRRELRGHFDVVLGLLVRGGAESLEVALARLEDARGDRWSLGEREAWRRRLMIARARNIARLAAYRDRGVFPLNEGQAAGPAPIFVDRHDTACAVGHLMRCSGWRREVDFIAATDLLVYVPDVESGPLREWVLTSGLTQEEAALIQPSYAPPISTTPMSDLSGTGASVVADAGWFDGATVQTSSGGLVYENFLWRALTPTFEGSPISGWLAQTPGTPLTDPDPQDFGARTDFQEVTGRIDPGCEGCNSTYSPDWPYANAMTVAPDAEAFAVATAVGDIRYFWLSFDIVAPDPALLIDRVGVWFPPGFNLGTITAQTLVVAPSTPVMTDSDFYQTEETIFQPAQEPVLVSPPGDEGVLGELNAENLFGSQGTFDYQDSVDVEPRDRVTVHTLVSVGDEFGQGPFADMGGLSHTVRLVAIPEAASGLLALSAALGAASRRGSRRG